MCGLCQLASLSLSLSLKMGRQPCCEKVGLRKGPWTAEEDEKLANFILTNGQCCWTAVPKLAGLARCGKNCRLRWINYLRPGLKRGILSPDEEKMVIEFHALVGSRWSKIASHLPGRTDNEIKNQWNTHIKKKLIKMGIDPATHQPLRPAAAAQQPPQAPPSENNVKQTEEVANPAESSSARIDDSYQSHPTGLAYNNFYIDEIPAAVETHQILLSSNDNNSPLTAPSSFTSPSPSSSSYSLGKLQFSPIFDHNYGVTVIDSIWSDDFSGLDLQMMINRDRN